MDCYYEREKQDAKEMPHILHPRKDLLSSSAYAAGEGDMVGNDRKDLHAVEKLLQ